MQVRSSQSSLGDIISSMETNEIQIKPYELPNDEGWTSIDNVPSELKRVIELYSMALNDNVEGNAPDLELDKLYEVYDSLSHQEIVVAEDSGEVVGVMSYDLKRKVPFFEGVAVDPEYRQMGVASKLTRTPSSWLEVKAYMRSTSGPNQAQLKPTSGSLAVWD